MKRRTFLSGAMAGLAVGPVSAGPDFAPRLVISGFRGTDPGDPDVLEICRYLAAGEIAGVILLRRNIVSPEQVLKLSLAFRAAAAHAPIISIDQEGGSVSRLEGASGFSPWMSAAEVGFLLQREDDIYGYYLERARELAAVGITLNFGPVVDLNTNPLNPIIGMLDRSYGRDPELVIRCASAFVRAHRDAGLQTCLKHFPGHGSSTTDSHLGSADVNATWSEAELDPFYALVAAGLSDSIMTSHLTHQRFSDGGSLPVSLSRKAVAAIRTEIGFSGTVISDDMQMRAIADAFGEANAAIAAVSAGTTFLIYANFHDQDRVETAARINASVRDALGRGQISAETWQSRLSLARGFLRAA